MAEPQDSMATEILRLGDALEVLALALRRQRDIIRKVVDERNKLRDELEVANTRVACLMLALRDVQHPAPPSRQRQPGAKPSGKIVWH